MIDGQIKAARYRAKTGAVKVLRGEGIFAGTDHPRAWFELVGQTEAVTQLKAACLSARLRNARLDHTLLASGLHGIGKTSLAKLIAAEIGAGLVEMSGKVSVDEARAVLMQMEDGDVLFLDEIHMLVSGGKAGAEWLLPLLQNGVLLTAKGAEEVPKVTILGATTDVQKLPETIISRFKHRPVLVPYTDEEGAEIALIRALKLGFGKLDELPVPDAWTCKAVTRAAMNNPRDMETLLVAVRDSVLGGQAFVTGSGMYDLETARRWLGLTEDGLNRLAQDYLCLLLVTYGGKAGEKTIRSALGEPGPVTHTEKLLTQKGLVITTSSGRELTEAGIARTEELLAERGLLAS